MDATFILCIEVQLKSNVFSLKNNSKNLGYYAGDVYLKEKKNCLLLSFWSYARLWSANEKTRSWGRGDSCNQKKKQLSVPSFVGSHKILENPNLETYFSFFEYALFSNFEKKTI